MTTEEQEEKQFLFVEKSKRLLVFYLIPTALSLTIATAVATKSIDEKYQWWVFGGAMLAFIIVGYALGKFVRTTAKLHLKK